MTKEIAVLEIVDESNPKVVSVILFDLENKTIVENPVGVMTRQEAFEEYQIVGEIVEGKIQLNGEEDDDWIAGGVFYCRCGAGGGEGGGGRY